MNQTHLFEIIERAIFHFRRVDDGNVAFHQGSLCNQLTFLMSGELVATTQAPHANFSFEEVVSPNTVIEPHSLFGKSPCYKATYVARGNVSLLSMDKRYVYTLLDSYEVFRINMLNLLSCKTEELHERIWSIGQHRLEGRMALLIRQLCTIPAGPKVLHIRMEDFAWLLDDTRLNVSRILNEWHSKRFITLRRKEVIVHDMRKLLEGVLQ